MDSLLCDRVTLRVMVSHKSSSYIIGLLPLYLSSNEHATLPCDMSCLPRVVGICSYTKPFLLQVNF